MKPATLIDDHRPEFEIYTHSIRQQTRNEFDFIDLTAIVADHVKRSAIECGMVNIQTRHTTTAIIVNEHEPMLLEDLKDLLKRLAPREARYRHDDLDLRTLHVLPGEPANGHSHARALMLGTAECLNIVDGRLSLGRWQRVFLVELDGPRERTVSINVMGMTTGAHRAHAVANNGRDLVHAPNPGAA